MDIYEMRNWSHEQCSDDCDTPEVLEYLKLVELQDNYTKDDCIEFLQSEGGCKKDKQQPSTITFDSIQTKIAIIAKLRRGCTLSCKKRGRPVTDALVIRFVI